MAVELRCAEGGYLVGPSLRVPDDPAERAWPDANVVIGCNQLRCERCGSAVMQHTGVDTTPRLRERLAEVHASARWDAWVAAGVLAVDARVRLYLCRCATHAEQAVSPVIDDPEGRPGGPPGWRCAGHPPPAAAASHDDAGPAGFVAAAFAGEGTGPEAVDRHYHMTADRALRAALGEAVLGELAAADPRRRMRALGFFLRNPHAPQASQLAALYRTRRELFDGVPDPFGQRPSVAAFLLEVLAARLRPQDSFADAGAARDVIREQLLRGAPVPDLALTRLAAVDEPWLAEHAAGAVAAVPAAQATEVAGAIVYALRYLPDDTLADLLARIAAVPGVDRTELCAFLVDAIGGRTGALVQRTLRA